MAKGDAPHRSGGAIKKTRLKNFIERIERLEETKTETAEEIRTVFGEAKGEGFDPKIMRQCLKLRKMEPAEREEDVGLLETYMAALGHGPLFGAAPREAIENGAAEGDGKVVGFPQGESTPH